MSEQQKPLLLFPQPALSEREKRQSVIPHIHLPSEQRQSDRLGPKFAALQSGFDKQRLQLQTTNPSDDPELVIVFETIGSVDKFLGAVKRTPGLEWLFEFDEVGVAPDDDFFDRDNRQNTLTGRLFLLGSNQQALNEIVKLWERYHADSQVTLGYGLGVWKEVFKHLRDVRFWGRQDRIGQDIRQYWEERLSHTEENIRFEIEAWCYSSPDKNNRTVTELERLVVGQGGKILKNVCIEDIAYHGFLVEMPANGVRQLLGNAPQALLESERVMFFRPRGQALAWTDDDKTRLSPVDGSAQTTSGLPIVALLDGLPLQNHPLLAGRLTVDDPDGWETSYAARDRVHATAMASLILYGELDSSRTSLGKPIYSRPIMRPDQSDTRIPRAEATPDDMLLVDLLHRAVKRIFEGEGDSPPSAPTIKIINLSIGDSHRPFDQGLSPLARLLDWLSSKYQVLFVVSAGNRSAELTLASPRSTLPTMTTEDRNQLALAALLSDSVDGRLLAPAESINSITVGALHADNANYVQVGDRYDLFPTSGISPYSCIGHGFRKAVKPDIMMPGGRALHRENPLGVPEATQISIINGSAAPGHLVAAPPDDAGQNTKYARGTSNATALATRGAAQAHSVIEMLRASNPASLPERFDAVLLKAMLTHGAEWGDLENQIHRARPELTDWREKQSLVTRFIGYGLANIDRAITCTEKRATLVGVGELKNNQALEFKVPLPPSLNAKALKRRLTVTLAWFTPITSRHAKYRAARLWIKPPHENLSVSRQNCDWQHVQRGTIQHEIFEGENAAVFADGDMLVFKVNCAEDGGKLVPAVPFALCVTLEIGEGVNLPIYQEIQERISVRVGVAP